MFKDYFKHLVEYQNQLLPDNKLNNDYIIIYEYLMDLLQKDAVVAEVLVRKKQQISNINADILLDLTKIFDARAYLYEPYICLSLTGRNNERFASVTHPFCNSKQSIIPQNIKKTIWTALQNGLLTVGSFIRGHHGDIYEISLCSNDPHDGHIRLNAYSDDVNLNINLRILIKYSRNPYNESPSTKPYPSDEIHKTWLLKLPKQFNAPFEVCLPKLENEIKQKCFKLVTILRLHKFLFKKDKKLCILDAGFIESITYLEYTKNIRVSKQPIQSYAYIYSGLLLCICKALRTKAWPCYWNENLNLIKSLDNNMSLFLNAFQDVSNHLNKFKTLRNNKSLQYDEFFEFFDFKMEPFSYEVDQFGIFKSY